MMPYIPTIDRPPNIDGTLEQVLVEAGYHSPSPLVPPPPPPQPHSIHPTKMPPLTEERFMDAFMWFSNHTGIRLNEQDFFIDGHQVNPWELYRTVSLRNGFDSVTMNGEWSMVGVDLGFHPVSSCGNPHPLAHCTPAVAHRLHQLYQDTLRHFDQAYSRGTINQLEYFHTTGQRFPSAQPQALTPHYQPLAYQPTEADYQALLATAVSKSPSVMTFDGAKNILPRFCDVSAAELKAHRVPQHVIAYIEHNRDDLNWLAQHPRLTTGFTPVGCTQFADQNVFNGVQAMTARQSLHFLEDHPQLQQWRSDREAMHGDPVNLPLPQQQAILASRAHRLAMMQASSVHSFEPPQQLPPAFNAGEVPSGNAHHQMDTPSQYAQVSNNYQISPPRSAIQTQDAAQLPSGQFDTFIRQGRQLRNDFGPTSRMPSNPNPFRMDPPQYSQGPGSMQEIFPSGSYANVPSSSATSVSQPPPGSHPVNSIHDVPLSQLRALSTHLVHILTEVEKNIRGSSEGNIQRQLQAKLEHNTARLRALQEVINAKVRESGDITQPAVNGPARSMSTLITPYTGVQMTGTISNSGGQNHVVPVSMNATAMDSVRTSSVFTQSSGVSQIRRPTQEDLIAAKRWIEEKKRMAFSSVPNFDRVTHIQSVPESDIQEYQRNLERLDQVLVNIEKYIHFAFAVLKKGEVVQRLFKMMAAAKSQLEELKKPNPRYVLELYTIRGMIQEADNMDKGLKAVLQRMQSQTVPRDGVPAPQPPPRLDSILILPPPTPRRDLPQGDDLEPARSPEGVMSLREGLFNEEVRMAMNRLEI